MMQTQTSLDEYRHAWIVMWPFGLLVLSGFAIYFLKQIRRSIIAATQQQLVELIAQGRYHLIEHIGLLQIKGRTPEEESFVKSTGGWRAWFMRRNIIMHLELLYFQNKYGAIDPAFFVSHRNHISIWLQDPAFRSTWERSKNIHVLEFQTFVDGLIKDLDSAKLEAV